MMHRQINQSSLINRQWSAAFSLMFVFFLGTTATAADSSMYIGKLPVPGTNIVSEYLTLSQSGTLLKNDQVTLKWQSDGNQVIYKCPNRQRHQH